MTQFYPDDAAITQLAAGVLDRSLPKSAWTHAAHFALALWLLRHQPDAATPDAMRSTIRAYNDATGTVNVDIDHKRWNGVTVTPQDVVEIQGEVDKDWNSVEIDVKQITKVAK